jgi:hypothetical protein
MVAISQTDGYRRMHSLGEANTICPLSSAITLSSERKAFFLTIELPGRLCDLLPESQE